MQSVLLQPIFIIAICAILGHITGKLGYKHFKLGNSATLFVGLGLSYATGRANIEIASIPSALFTASLIGFIVTVGLRASGSIKEVIRQYGLKFLALSVFITAIGALSTFGFIHLFKQLQYEVIGTYVGALTSSPGLATALELAENISENASAGVGLGYAISYIPGVVLVIFFAQLAGRLKAQSHKHERAKSQAKATETFHVTKFLSVVVMGILLGSIEINFGSNIPFSLGITGGCLISALVLGSSVKGFTFNPRVLDAIKDISLNAFLAIVGLNYGYTAISAIQSSGPILLVIGFTTGALSIVMGYLFGRYILKIHTKILVGGICGSMTSTPGLAAALDVFDDEEVVLGYGAAYPFALLTVIIFTNMMFR